MVADVAVLVTGATGVLGSALLAELGDRREAALTVEAIGCARRGNRGVVSWAIGDEAPPPELQRAWDVIVHCAANTQWGLPQEEAWAANVRTTEAVASLRSADTHFVHVSTAFVIGHEGSIASSEVESYRNTYEWSKAGAERLVSGLEGVSIVRPPLIIGRRSDGAIARFNGLYTFVRAMASGLAPAIIGFPGSPLDFVPVDDIARFLVEVLLAPRPAAVRTLTIAAGSQAPTVDATLDVAFETLNRFRSDRGVGPLERPPILEPERWDRFLWPFVRDELSPRQARTVELLEAFRPYLSITEPLTADVEVEALSILPTAVTHWATNNEAAALLTPKPWRQKSRTDG